MAYSFGGGVNAQLGAVDYSPFLRGSLQGSQMAAQGAAMQGQAIGQAGGMIGQSIIQAAQQYQAKKEAKAKEDEAVTFATGLITKNPEFAKALGIKDAQSPDGQKALRAIAKQIEPEKLMAFGMQLEQQQQEQQAISQAIRPGPSQAEQMLQGGANFEQLGGASFNRQPPGAVEFLRRSAEFGVPPGAAIGMAQVLQAAERQAPAVDPLEQAKTIAQIEDIRSRIEARTQPNLRDELLKLQVKQAEGAITAAEEKRLADAEKYTRKAENRLAQIQSLRTQINEAKSLVSDPTIPTTSVFGEVGKMVPGTPAYDLASKLETILANTGFDRLQQMREESPTGGALGQVAVQELVALQNSIASLKQGQSKQQLLENLNKVDAAYKRFEDALSKDAGAAQPEAKSSKAQSILDKYGIK